MPAENTCPTKSPLLAWTAIVQFPPNLMFPFFGEVQKKVGACRRFFEDYRSPNLLLTLPILVVECPTWIKDLLNLELLGVNSAAEIRVSSAGRTTTVPRSAARLSNQETFVGEQNYLIWIRVGCRDLPSPHRLLASALALVTLLILPGCHTGPPAPHLPARRERPQSRLDFRRPHPQSGRRLRRRFVDVGADNL